MKIDEIIENLLNNENFVNKNLKNKIKEILDINIPNEEKNIILINILDYEIELSGNGWLDNDDFLITPLLNLLNNNSKLKEVVEFLDDKLSLSDNGWFD